MVNLRLASAFEEGDGPAQRNEQGEEHRGCRRRRGALEDKGRELDLASNVRSTLCL